MDQEQEKEGQQPENMGEGLDETGENKPKRDEKGRLLPGNTANPKGRPVGSLSITAEIKKRLQECPEGKEKTYLEFLVNKILQQAVLEGNEQMIKQIWAYIDGQPKQAVELAGQINISSILDDLENDRQETSTKILEDELPLQDKEQK